MRPRPLPVRGSNALRVGYAGSVKPGPPALFGELQPPSSRDAAPSSVGARELQRLLCVCFSAGELRALLEKTPRGDVLDPASGADAIARELVKQHQRAGSMDKFLATLRAERPLVEWPAPPPASPASEPQVTPAILGLAPPEPAEPRAPPTSARAWVPPGHEQPATARPPATRADPKWIAGAAGAILLAVLAAYFVGRASNAAKDRDAQTAPPAPSAAMGASGADRAGPAKRAWALLERGLVNVAIACDLPMAEADRAIFARARAQCGRDGAAPRPTAREQRDEADATAAPPTPNPAAAGTGDRKSPTPNGGCIGRCDGAHDACRKGCGPEPSQSSLYEPYQQCLSKCLVAASKCRRQCD